MDTEQAHLDHLAQFDGTNEPKLKEPIEEGCCALCGEFIQPGTGATPYAHLECI